MIPRKRLRFPQTQGREDSDVFTSLTQLNSESPSFSFQQESSGRDDKREQKLCNEDEMLILG
jgi:hypothetical protein